MAKKLTNNQDVPFELCFKYPLEKSYTFEELTRQNNKELQAFLNKVSRMSVQDVDKTFGRPPDKNDKYKDSQVYHYAVTDRFRIHTIIEGGSHKVIRLDPNHKVHK